jgi:hypothetical protein
MLKNLNTIKKKLSQSLVNIKTIKILLGYYFKILTKNNKPNNNL